MSVAVMGGAIVLALLALCALAIAVRRVVLAPIGNMTLAMEQLAAGDRTLTIPGVGREDEVGKMAGALHAFKQALEAQEKLQLEASYKSAAFDGSSVATMMIDRDAKVIYVNAAMTALFRSNAEAFCKLWPNLNPEQIVGATVDIFPNNPGHQRQLCAAASRLPHRTDISAGELKIALNISAVHDDQRNYVGNILQWDDVTTTRLDAGILTARWIARRRLSSSTRTG